MIDPICTKRDGLALLSLLVMVLWFTQPMILEGRLPLFRDLGVFFYPMRFSLAQSLQSGELPLWNRQIGMGFPLMANLQSGCFYIPHLLFLTAPFVPAIIIIFILHYLLAACGSYLLCRKWGYSGCVAITGSLVFTLGGTVVSLVNLMNHFQAAVWLPWIILLWERYLRRSSWMNFMALTAATTLQFLAGSPEVYVMTLAAALLDVLRLRTHGAGPSWRRTLFSFAAVNVVLAGLAMVQILPTLELIRESRSDFPIPFELVTRWSLDPRQLINLFFLDREVLPSHLSGMEIVFGPRLPFFVSYYMGAVSLLGVVLWLYYAVWRERAAILAIIALPLVLALGEHTPVYEFLFLHAPGFGMMRFPEKCFFLAYVLIVFIALRGIHAFLDAAPLSPRKPVILIGFICALFVSCYVIVKANPSIAARSIGHHSEIGLLSDSTAAKTTLLLLSFERQAALVLALGSLLILAVKGRLRGWLFQSLFIVTVFLDLHGAHHSYQFLTTPDFMHERSSSIDPSQQDFGRLFYYPTAGNLHPSYFSFLKKPTLAEFNAAVVGNHLPNTGLFQNLEYMQEFDALIRWPYNYFLYVGNRLPFEKVMTLLSSFNVRNVISFRPLPAHENIKLTQQFQEYPSWHYGVKTIIPRTYIVPEASKETNPIVILRQIADGTLDPFRSVLLNEAVSLPQPHNFDGHASITSYENQSVAIQASLSSPGILVLADSYYPGWKAYLDDKEVKIYRANLFFRAVVLPAGDHVVKFRYEPASFKIGLIISTSTILLLIAITVFVILRNRESSTSTASLEVKNSC